MLPNSSLTELRQNVAKTFRRGGGSRPDVLLIEMNGDKAVLKDHGACDPWFASILGPLLAAREARAIRRLHDVKGVPQLLARPDSKSLLLQYLPALPLSDKENENIDWKKFFDRLQILLFEMHQRGVAHCDLRSPFNTLIDANRDPIIVDFVAAVTAGRRWNLPANWVFRRFVEADRGALIKLKKSVAPELISELENERLTRHSKSEQVARRVGIGVRNLSRKLLTRQ